jgi:hypothetical protein
MVRARPAAEEAVIMEIDRVAVVVLAAAEI